MEVSNATTFQNSFIGANSVNAVSDSHVVRMDTAVQSLMARSVRVGSAGVIVLACCGSFEFAGTSTTVYRPIGKVAPKAETAHPLNLSVADQALEILAALSINKSELADIFKVARPTVYEWLAGKEPTTTNARRVSAIANLLLSAGVTPSNPLNRRFVRQPSRTNEPALLEALAADRLETSRILGLLQEAVRLGNVSANQTRTREERLRALGYDEPSEEQRKRQLANATAMNPWPRS